MFIPSVNCRHSEIDSRAEFDFTTVLIMDNTQTFLDWDTITNSVSVSVGLDLKFIKGKLGGSTGINSARTWTTQTVVTVKGTVVNGFLVS
ncbi:hypothetical protein N7537_009291 [Penicillium hordei]|uniref:Uncharacterized protein n=1 Tax=Penicillium hordei TaxID=40994 RepID=A0AAD6DSJ0_9EURO|nr:uncharacterized protein N7537_009291 [Penicillium hordei]KAJ5592387.1 hypothetical protein N7537_009291 [Penicillium hordei]